MRTLEKIDLNITNRCNFRCIHCCFDSGETEMSELPLEKIDEIFRDGKDVGVWRVDITGGETLVRKDIFEIIKLGKSYGFKLELLTNGSLLTREKLRKLKEIGLDALGISLDGSDSETYNKIRKKDQSTFNKVIENIKYAIELGFYVKINTTLFNSNFNNIVNITRLARKLKANEHGIYYFTPVGRGNLSRHEVVDPELWLKSIREKLSKEDYGIKLSIELTHVEPEIAKDLEVDCFVRDARHLQILPDGNVYPCAIMASKRIALGNVHKRSLKEIFLDGNNWKEYNKIVDKIFEKYNGCVDFSGCHDKKLKQYKFVCPCSKYKVKEQQK